MRGNPWPIVFADRERNLELVTKALIPLLIESHLVFTSCRDGSKGFGHPIIPSSVIHHPIIPSSHHPIMHGWSVRSFGLVLLREGEGRKEGKEEGEHEEGKALGSTVVHARCVKHDGRKGEGGLRVESRRDLRRRTRELWAWRTRRSLDSWIADLLRLLGPSIFLSVPHTRRKVPRCVRLCPPWDKSTRDERRVISRQTSLDPSSFTDSHCPGRSNNPSHRACQHLCPFSLSLSLFHGLLSCLQEDLSFSLLAVAVVVVVVVKGVKRRG